MIGTEGCNFEFPGWKFPSELRSWLCSQLQWNYFNPKALNLIRSILSYLSSKDSLTESFPFWGGLFFFPPSCFWSCQILLLNWSFLSFSFSFSLLLFLFLIRAKLPMPRDCNSSYFSTFFSFSHTYFLLSLTLSPDTGGVLSYFGMVLPNNMRKHSFIFSLAGAGLLHILKNSWEKN